MSNVLITGFERFHAHATNPSQLIVERLRGSLIAGAKTEALILPVAFGEDTKRTLPAIDALKPVAVLEFGLKASGSRVDIEMFAINHRMTDAADALIPIVDAGPAAYFATIDPLPVAASINARLGAIAQPHGYAGSYLCNHIFYQTLHYAQRMADPPAVGFIHVPMPVEYAKPQNPSSLPLSLDQLTEAARIAIQRAIVAAGAR